MPAALFKTAFPKGDVWKHSNCVSDPGWRNSKPAPFLCILFPQNQALEFQGLCHTETSRDREEIANQKQFKKKKSVKH